MTRNIHKTGVRALSVEDQLYVVSEWAFYSRSQRDIGREFGLSTGSVCNLISGYLAKHNPVRGYGVWDNGWPRSGYAAGRVPQQNDERRELAAWTLGHPVTRREPDLGDLWVE